MEFLIDLTGGGLALMTLIAITYIVFQLLQKRSEKEKKKKEDDICSSLECIRCNRKLFVLREARRRLTLYILECGNTGLCRLQDSLSTRFHYTSVPDSQINTKEEDDKKKHLRNPVVFQMDNLPSSPWWVNNNSPDHHRHSNGKADQGMEQFTRINQNLSNPIMSSIKNTNSLNEDIEILHKNFGVISEEFHQMWNISGEVRGQWKTNATSQGQWSLFHLQNQGQWLEENAKYCPKTINILSTLPNLMTENVFGNVYFSVLYPGTDIAEHYGSTNIRIRCHLGLLVPSNCYLTVGGESHHWKARECLVFDDSYLHSAHHHGSVGDGPRIVLLMDLWHPGITSQERRAIEGIFPPGIEQKQQQP